MADVISFDGGRSGVKVYTGSSLFTFPSIVGEGRELTLVSEYDGYHVKYNGKHHFVGELAENESDFCRSMMTDDKAHEDSLILALSAIHHANLFDVTVITGLPVAMFNAENKRKMHELLVGQHDVTVNGSRRVIRIHDVKVAVEGGGAFWSSPQDGLVRVIDAGAKTVNYVTLKNRRYVDRESGTLPFGFNTNKTDDPEQIAARIAGDLGKRWKADDTVLVSGGRAEKLSEHLRKFFPKAEAFPNALFANAVGFYRMGKALIR